MITGPASNTAPTPSGLRPGIATRAPDTPPLSGSPGLGLGLPGMPASRPKPPGAALAASRPRRATLPGAQALAAGAATPVAGPALDPKYHADLLRRIAMYRSARDSLQQGLEEGALDLPARSRHDLMGLHKSIGGIESLMPYLLEGKSPPYGGKLAVERALTRYLTLEQTARGSLRELIIGQPQWLLPVLPDMTSLSDVADDLKTTLDRSRRMFQSTAPEVCNYVEDLAKALDEDLLHSLRETRVQHDILVLLGGAVHGFTRARLDRHRLERHRRSVGCWIGQTPDPTFPRSARAADASRGDAMTPQAYGLQINRELNDRLGKYFDAMVLGDKEVDLSLKPSAPGSVSTRTLLQELELMSVPRPAEAVRPLWGTTKVAEPHLRVSVMPSLGTARKRQSGETIDAAVQAAIKASPDMQWVRQDGVDRLALTQSALARMPAGSSLDVAPRDRLQARMAHVADGLKLSEFKAALITTFRGDIQALDQRA